MARLVGAAASLLVLASAALGWIEAPLGGALRTPIALLAAASGIAGLMGWRMRSSRLVALSAALGLALCAAWLVNLAVRDPRFWLLAYEHAQYAGVAELARTYLPGFFTREPTFVHVLPTEQLGERLSTALYFMGRGWWACLAGSTLALALGLRLRAGGSAAAAAGAALALLLAVPLAVLGAAVAGDMRRLSGDAHLAAARYDEALAAYEAAARLDPQLGGSPRFVAQRGLAKHYSGRHADAEALFALARLAAQRGRRADGLALLRQAAPAAAEPLRSMVRRTLCAEHLLAGLEEYGRGGFAPAARAWERAAAIGTGDVRAGFLLARAYFAETRYDESIAAARTMLERSRNPRLNARAHAIIGDSLWRKGDWPTARAAYNASRLADPFGDYRAYWTLGGL